MILQQLTVRGFRSFRDEVTVQFPTGPLFICGRNHDDPLWNSNGAGKTSLMVAVFWALWGLLPTGAKKDQVIHDQTDEAYVEASFGALVVRRRKMRNHPEVLSYFHDGRWHEPDLDVAQAGLEALLGMGANLAQNSVWVGPDSKTVQFLYARPADRLALVEALTENAVLETGRRRANRRTSELQDRLKTNQVRIDTLLKQKQAEEAKLLRAQVEYQRVYDDNQSRQRRLENQAQALKTELRRVEYQVTELEQVDNVSALQAQLQALKLERRRALNVSAQQQVCPTCRRPL